MTHWLNTVERRQSHQPAQWLIGQVAIDGCVDLEDKGRKEHVHTNAMQAKEATAFLVLLVSSETVERVSQHGHVEAVADENSLPIERDYGGTRTQNGRK
jgi:hypothetical protein